MVNETEQCESSENTARGEWVSVGLELPGECRYEKFLHALVPDWYPDAERYEFRPELGHRNATQKPPTGNDLLDSTPRRISETTLPTGLRSPR